MIHSTLSSWPNSLQIILLGAFGVLLGVLVNIAICKWTSFVQLYRPVSPWLKPHAKESSRRWLDYIPIFGWPGRRRDESLYGSWFWLRPMLIETAWLIFLPAFYFWIAQGGLFNPNVLEWGNTLPTPQQIDSWFVLYTVLIGLMCIGTFIDFDEKMIPDSITIPGTLIALGFAGLAPWSRLPEFGPTGEVQAIDYLTPNVDAWTIVTPTASSLAIALVLFLGWLFVLLPMYSIFDVGWKRAVKYWYAVAFRPKRKTKCDLRVKERQTPRLTIVICVLALIGPMFILGVWAYGSAIHWQSLFGSLIGMAFGGGLIWGIRIVGNLAMGEEAMGFGDVTLMAMIGATMGWQAALIVFIYTIVVICFMLVILLLSGSRDLAFGPYLCAGAMLAIFRWSVSWPAATVGMFQLGWILLAIIGVCLLLMGLMLMGIQAAKAASSGA